MQPTSSINSSGLTLRVLLNFDINGTLFLKDTSKGAAEEYMIISVLSDNIVSQWDANTEAMSFKQYAYNVLCPGDKSDPQIKLKRQNLIENFLVWMDKNKHPALGKAIDDYYEIKEKFTDSKGQINYTVFPSFYRMLDKLREMHIPFTIILRTFGNDLPEVVKEIEAHSSGVEFHHWAEFKGEKFNLKNRETIEKVEDIFDLFLQSKEEHFAVKDDWDKWNKDGEKGRSGKPFLFDKSGNRKEVRNLSLFFDDNITGGKEKDKELCIVNPREVSGEPTPLHSLHNTLAFEVNTKEAILDNDYFIKRVLQAIELTKI